ncbi:class I adenylate-forming enzyme family protein [Streptomyces sp. NPDC088747]|uniref:class I adenylate-forming enzyme family protein n=1 Tax=Streptomyces sp. NPDC088747 TaxID=3365886 RepID=UPI0037FBBB04
MASASPAPPLTLDGALRRGAAAHAAARLVFHSPAALVETDLATVHQRALRVAEGLGRLGVRPGEVVAVQLTNSPESLVAHAAVLLRGAVLLPVIAIYGNRELGFILRQSKAVALIAVAGRAARALNKELSADLRHVVSVGPDHPQGAVPWEAVENPAAALGPQAASVPPGSPDDLAALVYTSGTTGEPKGVRHTHRSLLAEVATMPNTPVAGAYLNPFPPGHIASLGVLLRTMIRGISAVFLQKWDGDAALDLIHTYDVRSSGGVPFHLAGLLDAAQRSGRGTGPLRDYLVGAANVAPVLVRRAAQAGIAAYRSYGSSEHPTITSGRPEDPLRWRAHTDGRPQPGCEIRVVGFDGTDVAPGQDGEILSRGPELFAGYTDPALNEGVLTPDGWLHTGDIGHLDDNGCLTITDRLKDLIVRGGEKIASKEVEDILATHPSVAEAAVVAEPDTRYGERVCAFVVVRDGRELTPDEVAAHFARAGVARQKTPERLILLPEMPRTPAGKIRKHDLRARLRPAPAPMDPVERPSV